MERFDRTYGRKLIYVFSIPDDAHKGLLKVGRTTIKTDIVLESLKPNCNELNQAAIERIKDYTRTAGTKYHLEYTELARVPEGQAEFDDKDVHEVLKNSGIHQVRPNDTTGEEWFEVNLETVKRAIQAVKEGKRSITPAAQSSGEKPACIEFREEQEKAIERTIKVFKKDNEMLWYAKMRFGKTLTALEVIRRMQYRRVIIVTHRPVVDDGWSEDFKKIFFAGHSEHDYVYERKTKDSAYVFDEKTDAENDLKISKLVKDGTYFIYFASMQDLRGSQLVGGNYNKNNAVFDLDWDLIVIDEAHEGTQTELGGNVIEKLRKKKTKVLALSGTPFNLLGKYGEENVYTWDYVMEQKAKNEWDLAHHGDHNPYADLPKMHIYTYDLGEKLKQYVTDEYDTKAFNFREFFRVWYKGPNGRRELPKGAVEGKFVHENDVLSFLNMMVREDDESNYPFANQAYRDMFRHTLWMVPGVKEARALSELLRSHPVFSQFGIANVAGEGDRYEEEHSADALELVRNTIKNYKYSITLSCGKLTTGVTVKEWTAVLMLSGSYSTAAAQYMQTIFRVQSAGSIDGMQKTDCYVFDFAPDRTLKVLTETVHLSRKPGKSEQERRKAMADFLNFCPVIAVAGSRTCSYSVESMMEQIKQIYAERAVNSGFDDESIYNDELLKLDGLDADQFNKLKDIIGSTKAQKKKAEVVVNDNGLTDEQIEHADDPDQPDTPAKPPLTPEEIAEREKIKKAKANRKKAIDILRGISIRMPLMIYGADVSIDEDIDIDRFVDLVDPDSWNEFMPQGVTKELFMEFTKYYDRDVFIAAGKRIRKLAAAADKETPTRRVIMIAEIFRHFKNPDKETVLTPWRVVNMHMSDTIGGWCFFNEKFEDDTQEEKHRLTEPRFVDQGDVTKTVFAEDARILEINSKSGLYPLYVAYSFYRQRMEGMADDDWAPEECQYFWNEVIRDNVYVICKTPMAKSITQRTLCGYSGVECNAQCFDNLVGQLKDEPEQFREKVLRGGYWGKKDVKEMKFDAVVGNPPYQTSDGGSANSALPIYQYFVRQAQAISPNYISMIMPSRWMSGGRGLDEFRNEMLHDKRVRVLHDYALATDCFPTVEIKGGICYFLWDSKHEAECHVYSHVSGQVEESTRMLSNEDMGTFIRSQIQLNILTKVREMHETSLIDIIQPGRYFGFHTKVEWNGDGTGALQTSDGKGAYSVRTEKDNDHSIKVYVHGGICYISQSSIKRHIESVYKYKVLLPRSGNPQSTIIGKPIISEPYSCSSNTYSVVAPNGGFESEDEAMNFVGYCETKLFRSLVAMKSFTQMLSPSAYEFVPIQDFSKPWTDAELYAKYGLSEGEIAFIEATIKPMGRKSVYAKLLDMDYQSLVSTLLKKYGPAKCDYFTDATCNVKNSEVTRTSEGLLCHHIDEDKAEKLSDSQCAAANPFDYQKADRLVYCNLLEHLLLHVKIAEKTSQDDTAVMKGVGGAVASIARELNDIYSGREITEAWRKNVADKVRDNFDDYIAILRRLWSIVEKNTIYKLIITKEMLCYDSNGNVFKKVLDALNGYE